MTDRSCTDHFNAEAAKALSAGAKGWPAYLLYRVQRSVMSRYHNTLIRLWFWSSVQLCRHSQATPEEKRFHRMTILARHDIQKDIVAEAKEWAKTSSS